MGLMAASFLPAQTPRGWWRSECFNTLEGLVEQMNKAPDQPMHVVVVPSSRNFGGLIGQPYCLVRR